MMGRIGDFDTDTRALAARIDAHAVYGSCDLEQWLFGQLDVRPAQRILELGCGTGKQTIPLARLVGDTGHVTAVDIAAESLAILRQQALSANVTQWITLVEAGLDETEHYANGAGLFDHVVACYSIYYANRPEHVLGVVHRALKPGGRLFFCGPAANNNAELKAFHSTLPGASLPAGASQFMQETGQQLARQLFDAVEVSTFENPLSFTSAAALHEYWRSYNLYDPRLDAAFKLAASEYFRHHDVFTTHKRALGVLATKLSKR